jgi:hypothetical protein
MNKLKAKDMTKSTEERYAYASILETLSQGLYPDKRHVLREFIQNSHDSIYELHKRAPKEAIKPIEVRIEPPSLFVADYGAGMSKSEVRQYRYIGYSQKERALHAGFRGIGKYSGVSIADRLIVDTSPQGVAERYRVIIHAGQMREAIKREKNPPLEEILKQFTETDTLKEDLDAHYTFLELQNIDREANILFNVPVMTEYLSLVSPVPLDPRFEHARQIEKKLRENLPDFLATDVLVNGSKIYKPYFTTNREPEFETVLYQDDRSDILAFCWYIQNSEKGQYDPKDNAGLVFRIKNIAIGDGHLTRQLLWKQTPERAFYFYGEIHVLDPQVVPSSDRTSFEDNEARARLAERCKRISSNLNRKAGQESAIRRFEEVLDEGSDLVATREDQMKTGQVPLELKDQFVYEIKGIHEDIQKRLKGPKSAKAATRAAFVLAKAKKLIREVKREDSGFLDISKELQFNKKLQYLYNCIIEVLQEEFEGEPERLERIVRKLHESIRQRLTA